MAFLRKTSRTSVAGGQIESLLVQYHVKLLEWSVVISRGDRHLAEELVQELCLHLCLARPDLTLISNLDGYLYTALRHLYLANMNRLSRERLRLVTVTDYDAVGIALNSCAGNEVDVQNDLLRICNYLVWRKVRSKSASQFLLHFFHGYHRSEVAAFARLPLSAVYNNIKDIRSELHEHLSDKSLRTARQDAMPAAVLLRTPEPVLSFLRRLSAMVNGASRKECLPESALIEGYRARPTKPMPLQQLEHLSGCAHCLRLVERELAINDHEGPLDEADITSSFNAMHDAKATHLMDGVQKRLRAIREHRPTLLAIAVDGHVAAYHDVQGIESSISARVAAENSAQFVEVYDELGNRLAYLPLARNAFSDVSKDTAQSITLSDQRTLELHLHYDGLGLQAEAVYHDPALRASLAPFQEPAHIGAWSLVGWLRATFNPRISLAMLTVLVVLVCATRIQRRERYKAATAPGSMLAEVVQHVPQPDATTAIRQQLTLEDVSNPKQSITLGYVELLHDLDNGTLRELYNAKHQKLAKVIINRRGVRSEDHVSTQELSEGERTLIASRLWESDLSGTEMKDTAELHVSAVADGFVLTDGGDHALGITSRSLLLNSRHEPSAEIVSVRVNGGQQKVRLLRTALLRVPKQAIPPDAWSAPISGSLRPTSPSMERRNTASLETQVLFELFRLHLDLGLPIMVRPTLDGHVTVEGTLTDADALRQLRLQLGNIDKAALIDDQIHTSADSVRQAAARMYGKPPQLLIADNSPAPGLAALDTWLRSTGVEEAGLKATEKTYIAGMLRHSELLLQHAAALQRVAALAQEKGALTPHARVQWLAMAQEHSTETLRETEALRRLWAPLASTAKPLETMTELTNARSFLQATTQLLEQAQQLNTAAVQLFGSGVVQRNAAQADSVPQLIQMLPLGVCQRVNSFLDRMPPSLATHSEVKNPNPQ